MLARVLSSVRALTEAAVEVVEVKTRDWETLRARVGELTEENEALTGEREALLLKLDGAEEREKRARDDLSSARRKLEGEENRAKLWSDKSLEHALTVQRWKSEAEAARKEVARLEAVSRADVRSAFGALREIEKVCLSVLPVPGTICHDDASDYDRGERAMFARRVKNIALRGMKEGGDVYLSRDGERSFRAAMDARVDAAVRRLLRHRERYLRAWVAVTGVDPRDAELVEEVCDAGTVVRVQARTTPEPSARQLSRLETASGEALDRLADVYGLKRGESPISGSCFLEVETDVELRARLLDAMKGRVLK